MIPKQKGTGNRTKYPCRCKKCYKRKTLARQPEHYKIIPACPSCGNRSWWVDWARINNPDVSSGGRVCYDDCMSPIYGRDFMHRVNTKGCRHYAEWALENSLKGGKANESTDDDPGF